ncbi:MAG: SRPBCC family protein [Sumerlaeia bacterium]
MPVYTHRTIVRAPVEKVWPFYTDLRTLVAMTPANYRLRVVTADSPLRLGARIRFGLHPAGAPFEIKWDAEITTWEPMRCFVDEQIKGPLTQFVHRHDFRPLDEGAATEVIDTIEYGRVGGLLGRLAPESLIGDNFRRMCEYGSEYLKRELEPRS